LIVSSRSRTRELELRRYSKGDRCGARLRVNQPTLMKLERAMICSSS